MEAHSNSSLSSSDDFTERFLLSLMTSAPCCVFLIINGTILFLLHSKPVFSQCPRYVLLFNLVLADTMLIVQGQTLYLLATFKVLIPYPLCVYFAMLSRLTSQISPLTLIFMSLERCIAVCLPFRHCSLVTLRNTMYAIVLIWTIASCNILIQIQLLLEFAFRELPDLQTRIFCRIMTMPVGPKFQAYETVYTYVLFTLSGAVIACSFMGVMVVAFLVSDRAQMEKTWYTLLLHLFQLSLNLVSVMHPQFFVKLAQCCIMDKQLWVVVYASVVLMPRCLSALTYGLRDPALRPALVTHLRCALRLQVGRVQIQVRRNRQKCSPNTHTGHQELIQ